MPKFQKGNPGKPKGALSKTTKDMKVIHEKILEAIQNKIGIDQLVTEVDKNTLLNYLAKVMPKDVTIHRDSKETNPVAEELRKLRESKKKPK